MPLPKTVLGGPCIVCGDYIFGGAPSNPHLAEHFVKKHGGKLAERKKRSLKQKPEPMFDLKEYERRQDHENRRSIPVIEAAV